MDSKIDAGLIAVIDEERDKENNLKKVWVESIRYVESDTAWINRILGQDIGNKGNIRVLLSEAIRMARRVQVAYQGQGDAEPRIRSIEPHRVMGNFVVAYLPLEAETVTLNINRITWARATEEAFAPP